MNTVSEQSFEKALDKIRELSKQNAELKQENEEMRRGLKAIAGKDGYEIDCGWTAKGIADTLLEAKE